MIVKDVAKLAKKLDKACKKKGEVISVRLDYVGGELGVTVHMVSEAFARHFKKYTVYTVPCEDYPYRATAVVDGVTYLALFSQKGIKKYGIDINGMEDK